MTPGILADLAWERLRGNSSRVSAELGIPSLALDVITDNGPARISIGGSGEARVLFPLGAGKPFPEVKEAQGLLLKDSVFQVNGRSTRFIDLTCKQPELEVVFKDLVSSILERIKSRETATAAVEGAISEFRSLLLGTSAREPSSEKAIGLLAELLLLDQILAAERSAWAAWVGPIPGRHDFRAGKYAIEVKGTKRAQTRTVEIAAIDQLAAPDGGELALVHYVFEADAGGPLSVPMLAARVCSFASNPQGLSDRLSDAGYSPEAQEQWDQYRFSLLSCDGYRVVPGFPRIIPTDLESAVLPNGVSHFRYRVDLGAASNFRLDAESLDAFIRKLASCTSQE